VGVAQAVSGRKVVQDLSTADRHHGRELPKDEPIARKEEPRLRQTKLDVAPCPGLNLLAFEHQYVCYRVRSPAVEMDSGPILQWPRRRKQGEMPICSGQPTAWMGISPCFLGLGSA